MNRLLSFKRRGNERGAVLILAIPALVMAMAAAALGVDIGRIALDRREDQSVADMAALDAARAVGFILGTTDQAGYDSAAQAAAAASVARNGFVVGTDGRTVAAAVGVINSANNFVAGGTSAVQVTVSSYLANAFMPGGHTLTARAVALVGSPTAAFSVGSTLASLDTSKSRLDPMLKTMLGASGSLSAVSYQGLAGANLSLGKLQTKLLEAGLNVGTIDQLLTTDIKVRDLLQATASALTADGSNVAATEINDLLNATISSSATVKLGQLISVAAPGDASSLDATFNIYQLVFGSAEAVNGTNFVSIPLTGVNLGSLGGVSLSAYVISPAQTAIGPVGTKAENTQIALRVNVDVPLGLSVAHVALTYTTAEAHVTLASIGCGATPSIGVTGNASAVTVGGTATTTGLVVGTMTIASSVGATPTTALTFNHPSEFAPTTTKHLGGTNSGVSLNAVTVTGSGATAALAPLLQVALPTTLTTLDLALQPAIRPLLQSLGLAIGQTDVAALGIYPDPSSCGGHPRLAQ
jgi:uncharacterized membrane protein